jgi:uncharacterized cupin superfamily protein
VSSRVFNLLRLELAPEEGTPDGHRFDRRSVTRDVGALQTGMSVFDLEPGQAAWPYHFELNEEEWVVVIAGEPTLRTPEGERVLRAGDVACFAPGAAGAHALRNDGDAVARFAILSSVAPGGDACIYPDSGKFKLSGPGFFHRGFVGAEVEYWEGES